jgi:kynurenine formamidase
MIVQPEHLKNHKVSLTTADIALFRFGYGPVRSSEPERYSLRSPGFGLDSAKWLRKHCSNLKAIGMDVPSLACISNLDDTMEAHNELLSGKGRRFLIIEDMNLDYDLNGLVEVRVCPWLVEGMDSSPCSVVGKIKK